MGLSHRSRAMLKGKAMKQYTLTNPMAAQPTPIPLADKSPLQKVSDEPKLAEVIYLGVDVHLRQQVVCRKVDGAAPQPAQRFTPEEFKLWVAKQQSLAHNVVCCYEAGPFGYGLQRHLAASGVECLVIRPQNWDTHGRRVKTDGRDACAVVVEHGSSSVAAQYRAGHAPRLRP